MCSRCLKLTSRLIHATPVVSAAALNTENAYNIVSNVKFLNQNGHFIQKYCFVFILNCSSEIVPRLQTPLRWICILVVDLQPLIFHTHYWLFVWFKLKIYLGVFQRLLVVGTVKQIGKEGEQHAGKARGGANSCATVALCHLPKPANPGPELYILR